MTALREIETSLFLQPLSKVAQKLTYRRRLTRAWRVIETEYDDPALRLDKVAKVSGISKNHLNVLLREATGFTFHELLTRYRLFHAATKMAAGNNTLLEIALESGFGSLGTMERNYRRLLGCSPVELRNRDL